MMRKVCKYENGELWWRGSNEDYVWTSRELAGKLMRTFLADPEDYAQEYGTQLAAVIARYDEDVLS